MPKGDSPLHEASKMGHTAVSSFFFLSSFQVIDALLGAKAAVDERNTDGMTPMHLAIKSSHASAVKTLLQFGADPQVLL